LYQIAENLGKLETSASYWIRTTKGHSKLKLNSRQQEKQHSERLPSRQKFLSKKHILIHACTGVSHKTHHFFARIGHSILSIITCEEPWVVCIVNERKIKTKHRHCLKPDFHPRSSNLILTSSYMWHIAIFVSHCIEQRI
jgi:hypothetical protein